MAYVGWDDGSKKYTGAGDRDYLFYNKKPIIKNPPLTKQPSYGSGYQKNSALEDYLKSLYEEQKRQQKLKIQGAIDGINAKRPEYEKQANNITQQSYISKRMAEKNLPEVLGMNGIAGQGLSESTANAVNTNYQNSLVQALMARDEAMRGLDQQVSQAKISGESDLSGITQNYLSQLMGIKQEQEARNYSRYSSSGSGGLSLSEAMNAREKGYASSELDNVLKGSFGNDFTYNPYGFLNSTGETNDELSRVAVPQKTKLNRVYTQSELAQMKKEIMSGYFDGTKWGMDELTAREYVRSFGLDPK